MLGVIYLLGFLLVISGPLPGKGETEARERSMATTSLLTVAN